MEGESVRIGTRLPTSLILEYSKVRSSNPSLLILEAIKTEETTISESYSFCFVDFQINK
jgi:hypothetical protein